MARKTRVSTNPAESTCSEIPQERPQRTQSKLNVLTKIGHTVQNNHITKTVTN